MAKRSTPVTLEGSMRVLILHGKEAFLRGVWADQMRELLEAEHGAVDVLHFDGAACAIAEVLDEVRSFGLMCAHKMVVVDQADQLVKEANRPLIERYVQSPCEGATLVLRAERWHPGKLDKLVAKVGAVIKCDAIADHQAINWALKRAPKQHGATIERDAAQLLVQRLGVDLARLDSELGKLAAGAGGDGAITRGAVVEMVGLSREEAVWSIQEDLLAGDAERAVGRLREAIEISRHPTVLVSYAFVDLARKVHAMARGIDQGDDLQSLAKTLKLWGPSRALIERAARAMGPTRASALLGACVDADAASKSGRGEPVSLLERLAIRFALSTG